jgi:NTP pyrophosphatase (non-canonical NTP hydrolase)
MDNYSKFVASLGKPGAQILDELTPRDCEILHYAVGVAGEAGELLDACKKGAIYRKFYDLANIKEELGDIEFYLEAIRQQFGLTREEIIDHNMRKLTKRYPSGYSNQAAKERADKAS